MLAVTVAACGGASRQPAPGPITNVATEQPGLSVTGIEPVRGAADGGTYVRILGTRFLADGGRMLKVYFGSRQGTVVRFASDTEVIIEAPGGKPGETVDVLLIFDPGGQRTLPHAFTFIEHRP